MPGPVLSSWFRKSTQAELLRAWDPRAHALTTIDELHRLTHDGMVFYVQQSEVGVPDGDFRRGLIRVGEIPIHFKGVFISASEGPVVAELYENTVVDTLGTQLDPVNANRMSSRQPTTEVYGSDTTFISNGSPLLGGLYIPQTGNQGVEGGTSKLLEEFILARNTDYQLSVQNDPAGAGVATIVVQFSWYEIDYPEDGTEIDSPPQQG